MVVSFGGGCTHNKLEKFTINIAALSLFRVDNSRLVIARDS
jgi:hypothetical protein